MMEHPDRPLPGSRYACLGAQPANTSAEHARYVLDRGGEIAWASDARSRLIERFAQARERFTAAGCLVHVSLDADVARAADVPGVSAPAAAGLAGEEVIDWARVAGRSAGVSSFEVVEINPRFDLDERSSRWAALVVWSFLAGLAERGVS
jgi:formiminoglutamase